MNEQQPESTSPAPALSRGDDRTRTGNSSEVWQPKAGPMTSGQQARCETSAHAADSSRLPVRAVSDVLIREAEFIPLGGGFVAVQPRKVEYAGVSRHGVAEGLGEDTALLQGARSVMIELAGVEFANRQPVGP